MSSAFCTVEFNVKCTTDVGDQVGIVGDAVRLGCWRPEEAIRCRTNPDAFPTWSATVILPLDHRVQYKYVIFKSNGEVDWEDRPYNRMLFLEGNKAKVTVRDGEYGCVMNSDDDELDNRIITEDAPTTSASLPADMKVPPAVSPDVPLNPSSTLHVVSYRLPIVTTEDETGIHFSWDAEALYRTSQGLLEALKGKVRVMWIGVLRLYYCYDEAKQEQINRRLLEEFNCVPVWPRNKEERSGHYRFCKEVLWDVFHNIVKVDEPEHYCKMVDKQGHLWQGYLNLNHAFAHKVEEVYHEGDMVWFQDYHLCLAPSYLRRRLPASKIGFFLHTPFPASQSYRSLPVRKDLLEGILSCSLIGFHLFDYARHFLSACTRVLGLEYQSQKGCLGVEYNGRHVTVRVSHIGIWPATMEDSFRSPDTLVEINNILRLVGGEETIVAMGIDDLDPMKGVPLKLLAWEKFLQVNEFWRGKIVLFQIVQPRSTTVGTKAKAEKLKSEILNLTERINKEFGTETYVPIRLYVRTISTAERVALYQCADLLLATPLREGLNLVPYEFICCNSAPSARKRKGGIVMSEFTGCSFALSGPIRVNPWDLEKVVAAVDESLSTSESDRMAKMLKDYEYVMQHTTRTWALSFIGDLWNVKERGQKLTKLGLGFGLGFRMMDYGGGFRQLDMTEVEKAYKRANNRLIVLDYEGSLTDPDKVSRLPHHAKPSDDTLNLLNTLASDPRNRVFVFSGRVREVLDDWFGAAPKVGLAAEQGFHYHLGGGGEEWRRLNPNSDLSWKEVAYDIMQTFVERTDGSWIDHRNSSLVWHFDETDYEFGKWQAKELSVHLESVLHDVGVVVTMGNSTVVVKPKGINKGIMLSKVVEIKEQERGEVDFILAIGDDRSDEDMFAFLKVKYPTGSGKVFAVTVGQKPSNASFYLNHYEDCMQALRQLGTGGAGLGSRGGVHSVADFRSLQRSGSNQGEGRGISALMRNKRW